MQSDAPSRQDLGQGGGLLHPDVTAAAHAAAPRAEPTSAAAQPSAAIALTATAGAHPPRQPTPRLHVGEPVAEAAVTVAPTDPAAASHAGGVPAATAAALRHGSEPPHAAGHEHGAGHGHHDSPAGLDRGSVTSSAMASLQEAEAAAAQGAEPPRTLSRLLGPFRRLRRKVRGRGAQRERWRSGPPHRRAACVWAG